MIKNVDESVGGCFYPWKWSEVRVDEIMKTNAHLKNRMKYDAIAVMNRQTVDATCIGATKMMVAGSDALKATVGAILAVATP